MSELFAEGAEIDFAISSRIGAWSDAIGVSTEFRWEWDTKQAKDPGIFQNRFQMLDRSLDNFDGLLAAEREILVGDIRNHFETETDPYGVPWAKWSPGYQARAAAENIGILRKTDVLFEAATDPATYPITGEAKSQGDIFLDTSNLPDYWAIHNYGGGNIPTRQFIGLSTDARSAMAGVFDLWATRNISFSFSPLTGLTHLRGPGGQFMRTFEFRP